MQLRVVDYGLLGGVTPAAPLSDGLVWVREGGLVALSRHGALWTCPVEQTPRWSRSNQRVYVSQGETVVCRAWATGLPQWSRTLDSEVVALSASEEGVDVLAGGRLLHLSQHGQLREGPATPARDVVCAGTVRWLTADDGLWRYDGACPPSRAFAGDVRAVLARPSGVHALVGRDGLFWDEAGLALVWSFFAADEVVLLPFGDAAWAVCDRTTGRGLRIVDPRRHLQWTWDGPPVRDVVVVGERIVLEIDGPKPMIGVVGPDTPPLWIEADAPIERLHGQGEILLLTHAHGSRLLTFQVDP